MTQAKCPLCDSPIDDVEALSCRPFCSPRCKKLDLMNWLEGRYTLPRELSPEEILELSPEEQEKILGSGAKLLS